MSKMFALCSSATKSIGRDALEREFVAFLLHVGSFQLSFSFLYFFCGCLFWYSIGTILLYARGRVGIYSYFIFLYFYIYFILYLLVRVGIFPFLYFIYVPFGSCLDIFLFYFFFTYIHLLVRVGIYPYFLYTLYIYTLCFF